MIPLQRLVRWCAPYRELLKEANARNARLRTRVAELDATVKALRTDAAVEHARAKLANEQRDRARDLVAALLGEKSEFSGSDLAWLDKHGVEAE